MTEKGKWGAERGPNNARDAITRAAIDALDATGINQSVVLQRAGVASKLMTLWRQGRYSPQTARLADVLEAAGLEFRIVRRGSP